MGNRRVFSFLYHLLSQDLTPLRLTKHQAILRELAERRFNWVTSSLTSPSLPGAPHHEFDGEAFPISSRQSLQLVAQTVLNVQGTDFLIAQAQEHVNTKVIP